MKQNSPNYVQTRGFKKDDSGPWKKYYAEEFVEQVHMRNWNKFGYQDPREKKHIENIHPQEMLSDLQRKFK